MFEKTAIIILFLIYLFMSLESSQMSNDECNVSIIHASQFGFLHHNEQNSFRLRYDQLLDLIQKGYLKQALGIGNELCRQLKTIKPQQIKYPFELVQGLILNGWKVRNDLNKIGGQYDILSFLKEQMNILCQVYTKQKPLATKLSFLYLLQAYEQFNQNYFKEAIVSCDKSANHSFGTRNALHLLKVYYLKVKIFKILENQEQELSQIEKCQQLIKRIIKSGRQEEVLFSKPISLHLQTRKKELVILNKPSLSKFRNKSLSIVKAILAVPNNSLKISRIPKPRSQSRFGIFNNKQYLKIERLEPNLNKQKSTTVIDLKKPNTDNKLKLKKRTIKILPDEKKKNQQNIYKKQQQLLQNLDEVLKFQQPINFQHILLQPPKIKKIKEIELQMEAFIKQIKIDQQKQVFQIEKDVKEVVFKQENLFEKCVSDIQKIVIKNYLLKKIKNIDKSKILKRINSFKTKDYEVIKNVNNIDAKQITECFYQQKNYNKKEEKIEYFKQLSSSRVLMSKKIFIQKQKTVCHVLGTIINLEAQVNKKDDLMFIIKVKMQLLHVGYILIDVLISDQILLKNQEQIQNYVLKIILQEIGFIYKNNNNVKKNQQKIQLNYLERRLSHFMIQQNNLQTYIQAKHFQAFNNKQLRKKIFPKKKQYINVKKFFKHQKDEIRKQKQDQKYILPILIQKFEYQTSVQKIQKINDSQKKLQNNTIGQQHKTKIIEFFQFNSSINPMQFMFCVKYLLMSPAKQFLNKFYESIEVNYVGKIANREKSFLKMKCYKIKQSFRIVSDIFFLCHIQFLNKIICYSFVVALNDVWTIFQKGLYFEIGQTRNSSSKAKINFSKKNLFDILFALSERIVFRKQQLYIKVGFQMGNQSFFFLNQFKIQGNNISDRKFLTPKLKSVKIFCQKAIKIKCDKCLQFAVLTAIGCQNSQNFDILIYVLSSQRSYSLNLNCKLISYLPKQEQIYFQKNSIFQSHGEKQRLLWNKLFSFMKFQYITCKQSARMSVKIFNFKAFIKNCSVNDYFQLKNKIIQLQISLDKKPISPRKQNNFETNKIKLQKGEQEYELKKVEYFERADLIFKSQMERYVLYISLKDVVGAIESDKISKINVSFSLLQAIELLRSQKNTEQTQYQSFNYAIVLRTFSLLKYKLIKKLNSLQNSETLFQFGNALNAQKSLKRLIGEIFCVKTTLNNSLNAMKKYNNPQQTRCLINKNIISLKRNLISTMFYQQQTQQLIFFLSEGLTTNKRTHSLIKSHISHVNLFDKQMFNRVSSRLLKAFRNSLLLTF